MIPNKRDELALGRFHREPKLIYCFIDRRTALKKLFFMFVLRMTVRGYSSMKLLQLTNVLVRSYTNRNNYYYTVLQFHDRIDHGILPKVRKFRLWNLSISRQITIIKLNHHFLYCSRTA